MENMNFKMVVKTKKVLPFLFFLQRYGKSTLQFFFERYSITKNHNNENHYSDFHSIDTRDHYFQSLFRPDTLEDSKFYDYMVVFPNSREKKIMCF